MIENKRNIEVIKDPNGNNIVVINDAVFKGRQSIDWNSIEIYLKQYINEYYNVLDTNDTIFIGNDLPDEYAHSNYTKTLRGANAKAKANVTQGIPKLIEIATKRSYIDNFKSKHKFDAKFGWYRYETRFAIPVFDSENEICRYNVFKAALIVRHANDGKKYLYDIINIKKETGRPLGHH